VEREIGCRGLGPQPPNHAMLSIQQQGGRRRRGRWYAIARENGFARAVLGWAHMLLQIQIHRERSMAPGPGLQGASVCDGSLPPPLKLDGLGLARGDRWRIGLTELNKLIAQFRRCRSGPRYFGTSAWATQSTFVTA